MEWLGRGAHRNPALQADWSRCPDEFRLLLVARTAVTPLLRMLKQAWIDRDWRDHPQPYNTKNAVPRKPSGRGVAGPPLPLDLLLYEPPPPPPLLNAYDRIMEALGDDVFDDRVWDGSWFVSDAASTDQRLADRRKLAGLFRGLPSIEEDPAGRVSELLRRVRQRRGP